MALIGRIEVRVADVAEVREVLDAALEVLAEVEGRGLIRSYELSVARLHRAFEMLALKTPADGDGPPQDTLGEHRWLG